MKIITKEIKEKALKMYMAGNSFKDILQETGIKSRNTISRWKKECGIKHANSKRCKFYKDYAVRLYRSGFNAKQISGLVPVARRTISGWAKKEGVSRKCGIISENETTEEYKIRRSAKYDKWRKSVFERDNYTCQSCNQRGKRLQAHHIYSFKVFPNKRIEIENGVTLCIKCHRELHSKYGTKKVLPALVVPKCESAKGITGSKSIDLRAKLIDSQFIDSETETDKVLKVRQ